MLTIAGNRDTNGVKHMTMQFQSRLLSILLVALAITVPSGSVTRAAEKSASEKASPGDTERKAKTPSEIAEVAKKSLVVVHRLNLAGEVDGAGSGFVVSTDGLIASSLHVIGESRPARVEFADGRQFDVKGVHAWDRRLDLVVLKIDADDLVPLPLGDSSELRQGDPVVAMGNPRGLDFSIVKGIVSAWRDIEEVNMIQLAIPIEQGNSGGPLMDMQGRVHGILSMKDARTENLGFATPVNHLKPLLEKPNPTSISRWISRGKLDSNEWTPVFGAHWSMHGGSIYVEESGNGFGGRALCLSQQKVPELPYEFAVKVRLDDESGAAGLVFAADGGDVHYGFYPSGGRLRLTRFEGATVWQWTILRQAFSPSYKTGEWNTLKVRLEKDRLLCYVNDELVIESKDDVLRKGKVGLAKFRQTKASFRQFRMGKEIESEKVPEGVVTRIEKQVAGLSADEHPGHELLEELRKYGTAGSSVVSARADQLEKQAARLRQVVELLHLKQVEAALLAELARPEDRIDLLRAALLLARLDDRELDVDVYLNQMDGMATELKVSLKSAKSDLEKIETLNRYLFVENGFHGNRTEFYHHNNSYVNKAIDDREGLPITLAVIYLELARRAGIANLSGAGLLGRFMVLFHPEHGPERLVDVFEGGRISSGRDTRLVLTGLDETTRATPKRAIIERMLRNLINSSLQRRTEERLVRYQELMVALVPESGVDRWRRAMVRLQIGNKVGAREDLQWLLENNPAGVNLREVRELLRDL